MKLVKSASGKTRVNLSKSDWDNLGKKAGWLDNNGFLKVSQQQPAAAGTGATTPPAKGAPAKGAPAKGAPATGTPATGTPATGTPATGTPPATEQQGVGGFKSDDAEIANLVWQGYKKNLADVDKKALDMGDKLDDITGDICASGLGGTFCPSTLGVDRSSMPQLLEGKDREKILDGFKEGKTIPGKIVEVNENASFPVTGLVASQGNILGEKVRKMISQQKGVPWKMGDPIGGGYLTQKGPGTNVIVSGDSPPYVVDGHHSWAAALAKDYLENGLQNNPTGPPKGLNISCTQIKLPIEEILSACPNNPDIGFKNLDDSPAERPDPTKIKETIENTRKQRQAQQQGAQQAQPKAAKSTNKIKLIKTANGKTAIRLSKKQWELIGKKAKWK